MAEQMAAADAKSVPAPEPLPTEPQEEPQSEEPVSEEDSQSERRTLYHCEEDSQSGEVQE